MINKKILIVAAHPDDEILGCGGTIAKLVKNNCKVDVLFLSEGVSARSKLGEVRKWDKEITARELMAQSAAKYLGFSIIEFMRYPNLRMDMLSILDISKSIQEIIDKKKPNIVFCTIRALGYIGLPSSDKPFSLPPCDFRRSGGRIYYFDARKTLL